jgi:hypothetical protein
MIAGKNISVFKIAVGVITLLSCLYILIGLSIVQGVETIYLLPVDIVCAIEVIKTLIFEPLSRWELCVRLHFWGT